MCRAYTRSRTAIVARRKKVRLMPSISLECPVVRPTGGAARLSSNMAESGYRRLNQASSMRLIFQVEQLAVLSQRCCQ